jgi:hypothetical protein
VDQDALRDPLDPAFGHDLTTVPMEELRRRRDVVDGRETGFSYVRRLIQGRLDIVSAEAKRRAAGEEAGDVADLVERLPGILGEQIHAPGHGRLPQFLTPGAIDPALERRLDEIVTTAQLSHLPSLEEGDLEAIHGSLATFEREVSATRRSLQEVLDSIKAEVVRRYRSGEASADDLL